jgi:hypothetical protein
VITFAVPFTLDGFDLTLQFLDCDVQSSPCSCATRAASTPAAAAPAAAFSKNPRLEIRAVHVPPVCAIF